MDLDDLFNQLLKGLGDRPKRPKLSEAEALELARNPEAEERALAEVLRQFDSDEIAVALARNPATGASQLGILNIFLPEEVAQNPRYETVSADSTWQRNQKYYARQRTEGRATSGRFAVSKSRPQAYRVRYYLEHGKAPDFRHLASLERIPNEVFRPHLSSRNSQLRKAIAGRQQLEAQDFEVLARDKAKSVRLALTENPGTTAGALQILAGDQDAAVRDAASAHPNCPADVAHAAKMTAAVAAGIEKPVDGLSAAEIAALIRDPATSAERLDAVAAGAEPHLRYGCGLHPNASAALLEELADAEIGWLREAPAFNPGTSPDLLERLGRKPDAGLQRALAANPATPEAVQLWLAENGGSLVRYTLANASQEPAVLERLCTPAADGKGEDWQQHLALVLDPKTKSTKLSHLQRTHKSRHGFVGRLIARHPNCPPRLYEQYGYYCYAELARNPQFALQVLEDPEAIPRRPAKAWVVSEWYADGAIPGHIADYYLGSEDKVEVRRGAGSPRASIGPLQPLVFYPDPRVRNELAGRGDLTRFMFEALGHDPNKKTRELIATHRRCPRELLALLAVDRVGAVRAAALANKRYQGPTRPAGKGKAGKAPEHLRNRGPRKDRIKMAEDARRADVLEDLAQDKVVEVRHAVARNERVKPALLVKLLEDPDPKVRRAAVRYDLPREKLDAVLEDEDATVRRAGFHVLDWVLRKDDAERQRHLARAAKDDELSIREFAAENITDPAIQDQLSSEGKPEILRRLARNPELSTALGVSLMQSDDAYVRREIAYRVRDVDVLVQGVQDNDQNVQLASATNPLVLGDPLRFATKGSSIARAVLAENVKQYDDEVFDVLVADPDRRVQQALAGAKPKRARVERLLAVADPGAMWTLARDGLLKPEDYAALARHDDPGVRLVAASSGELTDEDFERLLNDDANLVREGLSGNDKLTNEQRKRARETSR